MSEPLVSVVIPVFNGEEFLREALHSVFGQTYSQMEVLVADDGSTDQSVAIAREFPLVTVLGGAHSGVSSTRNRAVEASRGEFVAFLDADDTWYPAKLVRQVALAASEPHVDVVMALQDYRFDGPIPAWFRGPTDGGTEPGFLPSSWLLRRRCWDTVGGFDLALSHGEDIDWLARARDLGVNIATVEERLLTRRIHAGNASGAPTESRKGLLTSLRMSVNRKHGAQA